MANWVAEAPVLAGSAAVVLFMVGVAALLGFRHTAKLDDAELARLAAAEGANVEHAVIDARGRNAFVRLSGGKLMIARVMGNDVSARVSPAAAVQISLRNGKLSVRFADLGYPPLHMRLQAPPTWIAELAGEPK
ncbi:hypothetical protein [Vitreimonas sp.]|uniref:hypothetical protein n=1 Tax=Vitreimonas sp. TaxID=3069702 RepID=UPI002D79709E|nr:hypothetical protein [Vitreimonas sp.]